jgi:FtsP/CotA-like multicopper oxidase with cupredoxin domain
MAANLTDPPNPGRRKIMAAGAALAAGSVVAPGANAKIVLKSPPTTPFVVPLPVSGAKASVAALLPQAGRLPSGQEAGRAAFQRTADFVPQKYYELHVKPLQHSFHPELPTQTMWGYDGVLPGPTFAARYGEPVIVRIFNELPADSIGFGSPEISTHLHNLHCGSESDGYPGDYYSPSKKGPTLTYPGKYKDHFYPNCYAGYDQQRATYGDSREALGTLWYHDHRLDFTASNVYKGLAGFYLLFDALDSGDENDPNPAALRLPSGIGRYDIPLVFQDKQFDSGGYLAFDQFENDGFLGDRFCVNGKVQPYFRVERRKYRFRLLNGSPSRFYEFYLAYNGADQPFTYIANDGNLLPKPLTMTKVRLAPAERADLVIDFAAYPLGTKLFVVNKLEQIDGRGPSGRIVAPGTPILRFDVDAEPPQPDASQVPALLRALPPINMAEVVRVRQFKFDRVNGVWTVNGKLFDPYEPAARPKKGTAEIWELRVEGQWHHPVHIHFEEGRILTRNGIAPPPHEQGRKDVYSVKSEEVVRVFIRFRDFTGKYVMHCHNTVHEDHAMMVRWDIET